MKYKFNILNKFKTWFSGISKNQVQQVHKTRNYTYIHLAHEHVPGSITK